MSVDQLSFDCGGSIPSLPTDSRASPCVAVFTSEGDLALEPERHLTRKSTELARVRRSSEMPLERQLTRARAVGVGSTINRRGGHKVSKWHDEKLVGWKSQMRRG